MTRFDDLLATVEKYQALAAENYARVRQLAEELRAGLCDYLDSSGGICVQLVPPGGEFEPRNYGDQAFSVAPNGFRPLGPIAFGLAVRVTKGTDWIRVTMQCQKIGEKVVLDIQGGESFSLSLPLTEDDSAKLFEYVYKHVLNWFQSKIDQYEQGEYGTREIGFDFSRETENAKA
ncbi:hypothetical protein [Henriciella aquimarina]|uniref:hypothetical protein n=1 Tax=Henriciella aquimarina TaxID=545261 RepID=UPI000A013EBB|nr:hypothetical protein [Henriciella aquimarina]